MMDIHPLADIFPRMPDADYAVLRESVAKDGLLEPIMTYEGKILDGRHRARACEETNQELRSESLNGQDPLRYVLAKNLARRHMDESQRSLVAARLANLPHGGDRKSGNIKGQICPLKLEEAAEAVNVSRRSAVSGKRALGASAAVVRAVEDGELTVSVAAQVADLSDREQLEIVHEKNRKRQRELIKQSRAKAKAVAEEKKNQKRAERGALVLTAQSAADDAPIMVDDWRKLSPEQRQGILSTQGGKSKLNEQDTDFIEWARFSWNPVTGCRHSCPYCYARDIAERIYPQKFEPTFHPGRLNAPIRTAVPDAAHSDPAYRNIFTCSMADLFGQWVPQEWIEAVLAVCREASKWNFLMLTKFPQRAADFEFPDNVWMGTTVDAQSRVKNAEKAFAKIRCRTKWLSVEPLLGPLQFENLGLFQWIVIGGSSRSKNTPAWVPPIDWISALHMSARVAGLRIYYKTNCGMSDDLRVKEFPWAKPKSTALPRAFRYLRGM